MTDETVIAPDALPMWVASSTAREAGTATPLQLVIHPGEPWIEEDEAEFRTALAAALLDAERRGAKALWNEIAKGLKGLSDPMSKVPAPIRARTVAGGGMMAGYQPLSFVAEHKRSPSARQDGIAAWLRNEIEYLESIQRTEHGNGALGAYKATLEELERT